jgi:hypothetical protein
MTEKRNAAGEDLNGLERSNPDGAEVREGQR